jgi:glycosyltransferase involved in cell wall biosynthesis
MYSIIFYSESDVFGGHEKMAVAAHAAIQQRYDSIQIQWLVSERNHYLTDALEKAGLNYTTLGNAHAYSLWRNPLHALLVICRNAAKLRRLSPDLIVVVQGGILLSFGGLLSALIGGMPCCSYIPTVTRISDAKKYRFPVLADFLWSLLYKAMSSYITIDAEQAERLHRENRNASVFVVENYVPKTEPLDAQRNTKAALGILPGRKVLAVIGRTEFSNKCQDWILQVLQNDPFLTDKFVIFVGDGPDARALQAMLVPEVRDRFSLIGWKSDLSDVYAATDVLLIPSKSEGVPLVMLEALSYGIPVVGTDRDGMRSWLPAQWRFSWGDIEGLKHGIEQALSVTSPDVWGNIAERLVQVHDEDRFAKQFSQALIRYCKR